MVNFYKLLSPTEILMLLQQDPSWKFPPGQGSEIRMQEAYRAAENRWAARARKRRENAEVFRKAFADCLAEPIPKLRNKFPPEPGPLRTAILTSIRKRSRAA